MDSKEIRVSAIKSLFGLIPHIGTSLNEMFFEYPSRVHQKRIEKLVLEINKRLISIEAGEIKENFLKSEEFYDLTIHVFEKAVKTKNEEKIKILSNIYVNGIKNSQDIEYDRHKIILETILSIKPVQFIILIFINKNEHLLEGVGSYMKLYELFKADNKKTPLELEKYEFKYYVNDLESKGLITTEGGLSDFNNKEFAIALEGSKSNSIYLTDLGKELLSLMN